LPPSFIYAYAFDIADDTPIIFAGGAIFRCQPLSIDYQLLSQLSSPPLIDYILLMPLRHRYQILPPPLLHFHAFRWLSMTNSRLPARLAITMLRDARHATPQILILRRMITAIIATEPFSPFLRRHDAIDTLMKLPTLSAG
jgi:hypothetical protein